MSFPDFNIETTNTEYQRGLHEFCMTFLSKIIRISGKETKNDTEEAEWNFIKKIINNPEAFEKLTGDSQRLTVNKRNTGRPTEIELTKS